MAVTKYTYSIADDTANGTLALSKLSDEIKASSIVTGEDHIESLGDVLDIYMKDALSAGDKTILDGVVTAHDGVQDPDAPQEVTLSEKTPGGKSVVSVKKADGSGGTFISHDWTDACTWFQESTTVTGETLTLDTGKIYDFANGSVIDLTHGRVTDEDDYLTGHELKVYDNGVLTTEDTDYTMDYANGKVTFDAGYSVTGPITADYSHGSDSTYTVAPDTGKIISITRAELQFSADISMNTSYVDFEIWVYNPLDLPNKFMYKRKRYKNIKDIINGANLGQGKIQPLDILTEDTLVFPFDYVTTQDLKASQGAELRIKISDDTAFDGEWATVTIYFDSESE